MYCNYAQGPERDSDSYFSFTFPVCPSAERPALFAPTVTIPNTVSRDREQCHRISWILVAEPTHVGPVLIVTHQPTRDWFPGGGINPALHPGKK
jgi:hypothetical protein